MNEPDCPRRLQRPDPTGGGHHRGAASLQCQGPDPSLQLDSPREIRPADAATLRRNRNGDRTCNNSVTAQAWETTTRPNRPMYVPEFKPEASLSKTIFFWQRSFFTTKKQQQHQEVIGYFRR